MCFKEFPNISLRQYVSTSCKNFKESIQFKKLQGNSFHTHEEFKNITKLQQNVTKSSKVIKNKYL